MNNDLASLKDLVKKLGLNVNGEQVVTPPPCSGCCQMGGSGSNGVGA